MVQIWTWLLFLHTSAYCHCCFFVAPNCGGSLNQTDGILISPNYPNNYDHNGDCVWVISIPVNQQIALNFTDFAMESSSTCLYDYIEVR